MGEMSWRKNEGYEGEYILHIAMAPTQHMSHTCTLQFSVLMQGTCIDFRKHILLSFTGIGGDLIDELMSSDGKYLASSLMITSSSMGLV